MDVVASETHRLHDTVELSRGRLVPSSESPRRAAIITSALSERGHSFHRPEAIDIDLVRRVHAPDYVEFLSTAWDRWADRYGPDAAAAMGFMWPSRANVTVRPTDLVGQLGYHSFAADTAIAAGTWTAAVESAAIAQTATDRVVDGTGPAYALCRPPGHHATTDQFGGYCYLNNAAITAHRLPITSMVIR